MTLYPLRHKCKCHLCEEDLKLKTLVAEIDGYIYCAICAHQKWKEDINKFLE